VTEGALELAAVLVDDGSVDGTTEAVRERFPETEVVAGDGSLYWAGGMALAERVAVAQAPDCVLWLNDDVVLDPDAVLRLTRTASSRPGGCIAVGALRDPASGDLTYSGVRRRGFHPLRVDLVSPAEVPLEVETFNGNTVLVPWQVASKVGPLDGAFIHYAADFDYGLRARRVGVTSVLAPGTVGTCTKNPERELWRDGSVSARERLSILLGPKGLPPRPRARYLARHGGPGWFVFWALPYLRALPAVLRSTAGRPR
jgi:GT2 family glycosyltransferase